MSNKLPLFRGTRLKTNPAIRIRIYTRKDSTFLQVEIRGQAIGRVRRSSRSKEPAVAAQFGDLLMRHLLRPKQPSSPISIEQPTLL